MATQSAFLPEPNDREGKRERQKEADQEASQEAAAEFVHGPILSGLHFEPVIMLRQFLPGDNIRST
jgi:hypothetical protein